MLFRSQPARLARLEAALAVAAASPPVIERAGAADWIEDRLALDPEPGVARIVMHSVAFQYFGADSQRRLSERIFAAGEQASAAAPLVWLRFEKEAGEERYSLRLRTWPGGEELLAYAHPHGHWMHWLSDH